MKTIDKIKEVLSNNESATLDHIGAMIGISKQRVSFLMKSAGIQRGFSALEKLNANKLKETLAKFRSVEDASKFLNVSKNLIYTKIRKNPQIEFVFFDGKKIIPYKKNEEVGK